MTNFFKSSHRSVDTSILCITDSKTKQIKHQVVTRYSTGNNKLIKQNCPSRHTTNNPYNWQVQPDVTDRKCNSDMVYATDSVL